MKRAICFPLSLLTLFLLFLSDREQAEAKRPTEGRRVSRSNYQIYSPPVSSPSAVAGGNFVSAAIDTFVLAKFGFDSPWGGCDPQGWTGADITAQIDTFFHTDDFQGLNGGSFGRLIPLEGSKSLWCGTRPAGGVPFCSYATLPGYGDNWLQRFESRGFPVSGDVSFSYKVRWDSEPGYDFTFVEYRNAAGDWVKLPANGVGYYDGIGKKTETFGIPSAAIGDTLRLRFRFESDPSWSDVDGLWDTDGAVIIDSLTVADGSGVVDFQDFEAEPVGARVTADGDWIAGVVPPFGNFSGLFVGGGVLQEKKDCRLFNNSCFWAFFKGSEFNYACGGHPEQAVVPYGPDANGLYLLNEAWSPEIDWTMDVNGVPVPASSSTALLEFDVYQDNTLNSLLFYVWHVRSIVNGCPGPWVDLNFIIFPGARKEWARVRWSIGQLIAPGATHVQIALGVWDMCEVWCGVYGDGECHSHAPLFDNVRLVRVDEKGPVWHTRHVDLFNDNFPGDGTTTGTGRADMAMDVRPGMQSTRIRPGDSLVVTVTDRTAGLATDAYTGIGPAVYALVSVRPPLQAGKSGPELAASESYARRYPGSVGASPRFPLVDSLVHDGLAWYRFRMDTVFTTSGLKPTNKFCLDLNDNVFTAGDTILYVLSAKNSLGQANYRTRTLMGQGVDLGTDDLSAALSTPMEFQVLPGGGFRRGGDILYVDDADDRGGPVNEFFDTAFEVLGISHLVDRFDVLGPSSIVSNSLGGVSSVQNANGSWGHGVKDVMQQLVPCYRKIIWASSDLSIGLIGDGTRSPEKANDFRVLHTFLDKSPNTPGLYVNGDDVASEWAGLTGVDAVALKNTYCNFNLVSGNHVAVGEAVSPVLTAVGPCFVHDGVPDALVAYGGCPVINDFDVFQAAGLSVSEFPYPNGSGDAVISQATPNSANSTARVILSGFGYNFIRDADASFPPARVEHLRDILTCLENAVPVPTGVDPTPIFVNALAQNFPNPFNPVTTIRYSIREKGHVSLKIYSVAGERVRTLVDGVEIPREGGFTVQWDGRNERGEWVSSGVYFYVLKTGRFSETRKMVLIR